MITRFTKIRKHKVFSDFSWPTSLNDFGRFNLIYGWNGSGKTTLSNVFRCIEKKTCVAEGEVEFSLGDSVFQGGSLDSAAGLPQLRVFNRDYVASSIFTSDASLSPIFFLGERSVEKQKEVEALKKQSVDQERDVQGKQRTKDETDRELDRFCIQQARSVKDLLSSSPSNSYNNYNKLLFRQSCQAQAQRPNPLPVLANEERIRLMQLKDGKPKEYINAPTFILPELQALTNEAKDILQQTVVSKTIAELVSNEVVAEWVQNGLSHHTGESISNLCRFCGQALPKERIALLELHFNDEYNKFLARIDERLSHINTEMASLDVVSLPDRAHFYDHLSSDFAVARQDLVAFIKSAKTYLGVLKGALAKKRTKPFQQMELDDAIGRAAIPDEAFGSKTREQVIGQISKHNGETDTFSTKVSNARKSLEDHAVAEALSEYKRLSEKSEDLRKDLQVLGEVGKDLTKKIADLEKEVVEHRRPADELNRELESYLGRSELKFEVRSTGYQIVRAGTPASSTLSEGERTAIAFLYFLKSLQDKGFDLATGIVVIDDPVSSLDANALFCAFGYMKSRTKAAGQLFIMTHNFTFFRQVRNWFHHLRGADKKQTRFYFIEASGSNGHRNAALVELDHLLREFESEYHYLFKRIYDEATRTAPPGALVDHYHLPNMARRLIESFFAFRYPQERGDLYRQLERAQCDPATRARLLRFLDTYSHNQTVGEAGHDMSLLAETPQVLKALMKLLETEDKQHFEEMVQVVAPPTA